MYGKSSSKILLNKNSTTNLFMSKIYFTGDFWLLTEIYGNTYMTVICILPSSTHHGNTIYELHTALTLNALLHTVDTNDIEMQCAPECRQTLHFK